MEITRPDLRKIPARIHTLAGRISGNLHVLVAHSIVDHLDYAGNFLTLTDVLLPGHTQPMPFFALQRSAALAVIPDAPEDALALAGAPADSRPHAVACLLEQGVLNGTLDLPRGIRVSDHLVASAGFLVVRNCTLGTSGGASEAFSVEMTPIVLVNAARVIGVAEMSPVD